MSMTKRELKALRRKFHLTQSDLGDLIGLGRVNGQVRISQWEHGRRSISEPMARLIRSLLGVSRRI